VTPILQPLLARKPRAEWLATLRAAGIPCGAIKTVSEVCETPQLNERGMVQTVKHTASGDVRFIARLIRFDEMQPTPSLPPPMLGEHTAESLTEWLGWTQQDLDRFTAEGAFGTPVA
jgi:crotonobetainyl-CoA:carnitine CoA-transferase CaiB-like acyl-CoA transferase